MFFTEQHKIISYKIDEQEGGWLNAIPNYRKKKETTWDTKVLNPSQSLSTDQSCSVPEPKATIKAHLGC